MSRGALDNATRALIERIRAAQIDAEQLALPAEGDRTPVRWIVKTDTANRYAMAMIDRLPTEAQRSYWREWLHRQLAAEQIGIRDPAGASTEPE